METAVVDSTAGLWEAWIDVTGTSGNYTLYVIGDVCTGKSRTTPVLLKKQVQGAAASHLILEILPLINSNRGRQAEVGYAETIADIHQYQQISICAGEDIIARIPAIEIIS